MTTDFFTRNLLPSEVDQINRGVDAVSMYDCKFVISLSNDHAITIQLSDHTDLDNDRVSVTKVLSPFQKPVELGYTSDETENLDREALVRIADKIASL